MSRRNIYDPASRPGSTRSLIQYAREELYDAMVPDDVSAMMSSTYDEEDFYDEGDATTGTYDSRTTFDAFDKEDPAYLFTVLEEALPKQSTPSGGADGTHHHQQQQQQQKRDQVEYTWDRVRRWLWSATQEQRQEAAYLRGQGDATALHLMCKLHHPPADVIEALAEAAPETCSWTDSHGWLPLHHACANGASPDVLRILVQTYPESKLKQDNQGRTPLHFYATRNFESPAIMTENATLLSDTGAAELTDLNGMLPMHYACAYGTDEAVLAVLAHVNATSMTAKENHGRTPMHLAMVNAHRDASPNVIHFLLAHPDGRQTINTRDKDGYLPLHLLALGLKGYRADDSEKRANVADSLSLYLEAEPHAAADFLTAIQDLPDWLQDTAVVSKHVRNVLNKKIVQRFPTSILMMDFIFLIVMIVCFAITTTNHINIRFDPEHYTDTTGGALIVLFVAASYFLMRELIQMASLMSLGMISSWWTDSTNWLDMTVIVLVFYYAICMTLDTASISNTTFRSGVAFTQGVLWVAIIVFLKSTLVDFAVFVGGVFYVVQRLAAFILAVGVILVAFAQMFYFVYVDTEICGDVGAEYTEAEFGVCHFPHCSFTTSFLKVYTMMMGQINNVTRYSTSLVAELLFFGYAFLVVILLSNVLIAIVTDSYEIIQNDRAAIVFWSNRLDFVAEMDAISYAVKRRLKCFGFGKRTNGSVGGVSETALPTELLSTELSTQYFREAWHQVMLLFDSNLYDDMDWIETAVYNIFRLFCVFFLIPLWVVLGAVTAGWLWPPQIREYLFVQKETAISRAELERQKLDQLKSIQNDLKTLKSDIVREMNNDRDEMMRMKMDMDTVQSEVLTDLQQVKELMSSLLAG